MKAPRFNSLQASSQEASLVKKHNRAKNSRAEILIRKELWRRRVRYRLHAKGLPGKPDIVFPRQRVVVFVDGDFWHGRNWELRKSKLERGANADYWIAKIRYNRDRDHEQTAALEEQGWSVVRLWETDVLRNLESAVDQVMFAVNDTKES